MSNMPVHAQFLEIFEKANREARSIASA